VNENGQKEENSGYTGNTASTASSFYENFILSRKEGLNAVSKKAW
jgi:hypothetical protein